MLDLLLPRTDAGVAVQLIVAITVFAIAIYLVRRHLEWRIFVVGFAVLTLGLMALRTVH